MDPKAGLAPKMGYPCVLETITNILFLGDFGRGGRIRTADPLLPKQMRYQAALHPD